MAPDRRGAHVLGRYVLHDEFASGGMAAVHFGRLVAEAGFTRTVAIKRLHAQHAKDPAFVAMLLDEARLAGRIRHPNVAPILDVVQTDGEVFLVMEYVHGESLSSLLRATMKLGSPIPARLASSVVVGALHGLHAAHIATSENGEPLGIVHRDVSPENILVGADGVPRVLDFGIALASGRSQVTREGGLKGKLGYMAPELLEGAKATPISDVYSVGVVLWEALTGERLFTGEHEGAILARILKGPTAAPGERAALPPGADEVVMRALARQAGDRYRSADDFAIALETAFAPAPARDVATWVRSVAGTSLSRRAAMLAEVEGARPRTDRGAEEVRPPAVATEVLETLQLSRGTPAQTRVIGPVGEHLVTEVLARVPTPEPTDPGTRARQVSVLHARRTGVIVVAAAFVLALVTIGIAVTSSAIDAPRPTTSSSAAAAPTIVASTEAARPVATPAPPAAASVASEAPAAEATAAPRSSIDPSPSPSSAPADGRAAARARPPRPPRPTSRPNNCDPPYTIDERGIHHYKPGCL
jgi:eukaryotic-like serine/threonine-protein kinase